VQKRPQKNIKWKFRQLRRLKTKRQRDYKLVKKIQEKTKAANSDMVECEQCGLTFKTKGIKRHITVNHTTTTTPLTQ
jgi:hypothetical protein